jgi:hypothetical protein
MTGNFKGINWTTYVNRRNWQRSKGEKPQEIENEEDVLLDEVAEQEHSEEDGPIESG